jgi:hypothetical protein
MSRWFTAENISAYFDYTLDRRFCAVENISVSYGKTKIERKEISGGYQKIVKISRTRN